MNVHLRGAFLMTRAAQKHMIEAKFGRIVNLSSTSALGNRGQANYSAAKAGLQGFTKTLAIELGKFGVTANAIAPGFIQTEMTARRPSAWASRSTTSSRARAAQIPVARVGQPEDIAAHRRRSSSARAPASCPARSSTSPAGPRTDMSERQRVKRGHVMPVSPYRAFSKGTSA